MSRKDHMVLVNQPGHQFKTRLPDDLHSRIKAAAQANRRSAGYAVIWGGSRYDQEAKVNVQTPIVLRFAICKHEKVIGADARPERGWHPGFCKHCGLDMSVDSGD